MGTAQDVRKLKTADTKPFGQDTTNPRTEYIQTWKETKAIRNSHDQKQKQNWNTLPPPQGSLQLFAKPKKFVKAKLRAEKITEETREWNSNDDQRGEFRNQKVQ